MFDLVYLVPILFVLCLMIFFVHKAWIEMKPELEQEDFLGNTTEGKDALNTVSRTLGGFNVLVPIIFIFMILVVAILAYSVKTSPALAFIAILVFLIVMVLAVMFGNIFVEISEESDLANQTNTYSAPTFMMQKLPYIILVAGMIIFVALFAKPSRGTESGGI